MYLTIKMYIENETVRIVINKTIQKNRRSINFFFLNCNSLNEELLESITGESLSSGKCEKFSFVFTDIH
jgi:hypothetical protein